MIPNFAQELYDASYFEKQHTYIAQLDFSQTLKDQIGINDKLVVQLESDMRESEGWKETLTYSGESKQFMFGEGKKTWTEAQAFCQNQGGHLASIVSESENKEVSALALGDYDYTWLYYPDAQPLWVGGTDKGEESFWKWSDGSLWILSNLATSYMFNEHGNDCLYDYPDGTCIRSNC